MQQLKHPRATHSPGTIFGHRRNGAPIYAIAGGNGEGEGAPAAGPNPGGGTPQEGQPT
ncbi:hypothetical protein AB0B92_13700 [Streptomyces hygroscopicus]|uniref:hypothetical protein n=1 Tax=Streptomyces hygroscopicus TaxID=1912 RepID=UPI0033F53768